MRILVVDDSEDFCEIAEATLVSAGYTNVRFAHSALEALTLTDIVWPSSKRGAQVDIILLDIVMPHVDGIETCARIRSDARYSAVPIIMVTSVDDVDCLTDAFAAGASDYITKPVDRAELLARIRTARAGLTALSGTGSQAIGAR